MKVLIISIFWAIVFGDNVLPMEGQGHRPLQKISVDTFLGGMKTNENMRQHIEKILLDLKQYESLDTESKESCEEIQESFVLQTLQKIHIDGVLRRIAEITLYMGEGCTHRAIEIGNKFLKKKLSLDTVINCRNFDNDKCFIENEILLSEHMHQSLSVGLIYDAFSAAVYGSKHHVGTAEIHVHNIIKEVFGEGFGKTSVQEFLNGKNVSRVRRQGCVDEEEEQIQKVVSWIPVIGTIYNLASSAVYGATGCLDVAKERATDGALDLAMDIGTAVTFGAGAAAFQGIKVASKIGIKAGLQAAKSAGKQVVKSQLKSMVNLYKNPIKGAIKETVDTVKSVVQIPKLIHAGGERVYKAIKGKINKLDNVAETGNTDVQDLAPKQENLFISKALNRYNDVVDLDQMKNLQDANERSRNRAPEKKMTFDEIMNKPPAERQQMLDAMTTKEWAKHWQQQTIGTTREFKRVIGGQDMVIKSQPSLFPSARDQFLYTINNEKPRYNDITKSLDNGLTPAERKQLADSMLREMDKTASDSIDFAKIVGANKAKKASELIVLSQIAEAVPGRTPGSDKDFRAVLRSIKTSDGKKSFHNTIMKGYPPASQDGTSLQRKHAHRNTQDYNDDELIKRTKYANTKNRRKNQPNTEITETEDARDFYSDRSERRKRQSIQ